MTYQLKQREIDLTRHVRTPAGVARFHKPLGAVIGKDNGGPGLGPLSILERAGVADMAPKAPVVRPRVKAATPRAPKAASSRPRLKTQMKAASGPVAYARLPKPSERAEAQKQTAAVRRSAMPHSNLWQLDNKRLVEAINDPRTPADRKRAMQIERSQRLLAANHILAAKKETLANPEVKAALASADVGRISSALHKHAPKAIAETWDKLIHKPVVKLKSADHAQSIADSLWDFVTKALGGALMIFLLGHGLGG